MFSPNNISGPETPEDRGAEPVTREQLLGELALVLLEENARLQDRISQLEEQAFKDPLTGLGNRWALEKRFAELEQGGAKDIGILVMDLDEFKAINDRYGHNSGDGILKAVAQVLLGTRDGDLPSFNVRSGGDEFVVLVELGESTANDDALISHEQRQTSLEPEEQLKGFAGRIKTKIREAITNGYPGFLDVAIGYAIKTDKDDLFSLIERADIEMYRDKQANKQEKE